MRLEIPYRNFNPIPKDRFSLSLISEQVVGHIEINGSSIQEIRDSCARWLSVGASTNRSCALVIDVESNEFSVVNFKRIEKSFIRFLGFSRRSMKYFSKNPVVKRRGLFVEGIFPGTLNAETISFYRTLLCILCRKCIRGKRLPSTEGKYSAVDSLEKWFLSAVVHDLPFCELRNFKNRMQTDIFNVVRATRVER